VSRKGWAESSSRLLGDPPAQFQGAALGWASVLLVTVAWWHRLPAHTVKLLRFHPVDVILLAGIPEDFSVASRRPDWPKPWPIRA